MRATKQRGKPHPRHARTALVAPIEQPRAATRVRAAGSSWSDRGARWGVGAGVGQIVDPRASCEFCVTAITQSSCHC